MNQRILLQELCDNLAIGLNQFNEPDNPRTVEFFSGLKEEMTWYVTVSLDERVIFSHDYATGEGEDLNVVEEYMNKRMLQTIFTNGLLMTIKFMDERVKTF